MNYEGSGFSPIAARHRFRGPRRMGMMEPKWTVPSNWCNNSKPHSFAEVIMILSFSSDSASAEDLKCSDWLRQKITETSLEVRVGEHKGAVTFFISASYQVLLSQAEEIKMKKLMKPEYGGGLHEVTLEQVDFFLNVENEEFFFSSQERQILILERLNGIKAVDKEETPFESISFLEDQPIIAVLEAQRIIAALFPLHDKEQLSHLVDDWLYFSALNQPIDRIKDYFGSEIAFYFAWLGYYTYWLTIPTVLGFLVWCFSYDQHISDVFAVMFSILNVVWITLFLEFWKRKSSALAYHWGTLDKSSELLKYPRALFKGSRQFNEITGRHELFYPKWKRLLFIGLVTVPTLLLSLTIVFGCMFLTFELQNWMDVNSEWWLLRMLPKVFLSVLVFVSGDFYQRAVIYLNDKENYRSEENHRNGLIVKLGIFHFTNNFFSLFYIAFYLRDMKRLKEFLAALLITRQLVGNFKEVFVPYLMNTFKKEKLSRSVSLLKGRPDSLSKDDSGLVVSSASETLESLSRSQELQSSSDGSKREVNSSDLDVVEKEVEIADRVRRISSLAEKQVKDITMVMRVAVGDASGTLKRILSSANIRPRKLSSEGSLQDVYLTQTAIESEMSTYADLFDDYLEMFIQLGYVVFFSSLFPLAALCAFVNNVFEVKVDAFKITQSYRRPFGKAASGIGVWQNMMEVMGAIAVMVNCALLVSSGQLKRLFPNLSLVELIMIAVFLEHVALTIKWFIAKIIPDLPAWVEAEMAKVEFKRIQALRDLETLASRGQMSQKRYSHGAGTKTSDFYGSVNSEISQSQIQTAPPRQHRMSEVSQISIPGHNALDKRASHRSSKSSVGSGSRTDEDVVDSQSKTTYSEAESSDYKSFSTATET